MIVDEGYRRFVLWLAAKIKTQPKNYDDWDWEPPHNWAELHKLAGREPQIIVTGEHRKERG